MPPLNKSTAAAALLLAFAPLAVPDMAAAAAATTEATRTDGVATEPSVEQSDAPADESGAPEATEAEAPEVEAPEVEAPEAPEAPESPTEVIAEPEPTPDVVAPTAPATPAPTSSPAAVTPNETTINVYAVGADDVAGQPGTMVRESTLNVKNASGFNIPNRMLDYHWSISGPGQFRTSNPPFAVTNTGSPNVQGCTLTDSKHYDCIGANPTTLNTGAANYNHIRTSVFIDADALPGDVVTLTGWLEPNAASGYVNSAEVTSTTWRTWVPLTAAVIDAPTTKVDSTPVIRGKGVPGGTVDVTVGDRSLVTVPVEDDGTWTLPVTEALADGAVTVTAVQHRNGFTADPTVATLDVDATAPDAPIVDAPGTLTDPTGPITGVAEPGSTVIVRDPDGNELGRGTADDDGAFSVRLDAPLPEGASDLVVVAEDEVGNESDETTATAVVPDTTAPDAPVVDGLQDLASSTGPVTGTAEPGATVIVRDEDGNVIGRGTADDDGDFAVELDGPLTEGDHALEIVAVDDADNESTSTPVTVIAPDVTAPDAPISTTPEWLTDATGPFTGSAEPGSTVIIRDADHKEIGRGTAGDDGQFRIVLDEPLTDGAHDLEIVAEDKVGNTSEATAITVDVDDAAPNAPVVTSPTDLADGQGPITGTAEPGATVIVRDEDGNVIGTGTANEDGDWSIELDEPLADGKHDLDVIAKDKAGNTSTPTPIIIDVDTEAPDAPVVTSPTDLADGTGPITGTAEPGSTVIVRDEDGKEIGRGEADKDGNFTVELDEPLKDGSHDVVVVVEDKAGNESDPTKTTVKIDTETPDAPVVTSPSDLANGQGPITGTAEPGSTVIVRDEDGKEIGTGIADEDGNFTVELDEPLKDGSHDLEIVVEDKAGNESDPTKTTVEIDTETPDAPVVTSPSDLADGQGPIAGIAEPGSAVIVRDEDGNELGRGIADEDGNFEIILDEPLKDGSHELEIVVEDQAGNESDPTKTTIVIDTEAPDAPVITSPADLANGQGPIAGTAEPGSTVIVRDEDGKEIGTGIADEDGNFTVELDEPLKDGSHDLEIVVEDQAGNESDPTKTTVEIDTDAPNAPVITSPSDLADGTGPITGIAEPGSTVIVRDEDGKEIGRGTTDEDGNFTVELDEPLKDGSHDLEIVVEDNAGNESDPTKTTVDIDTDAPNAPVITSPSDLADGTGPIAGIAEPGSTVIVRDEDGKEIGRGTADEDGNFTVELDEPLKDGSHDLEIVVEDQAGNESDPTKTTVEIDTEAPDAPVITSPSDLANGQGPITGTAEPGATVIVRDEDGNELGTGIADEDGKFEIILDEPLKDGSHELEIVVEDQAGNESDPTKTTVDIDTIAPKTPVLEVFDDIVDGTGVVRGTAEPGTTVIIRDSDGREIGRGTAGADGRFAFRTTVPLDPGAHLLSVVAVDRVGNVSPGGSMLVTLVPESEEESESESEIALPVITVPGIAQPSAPATGGALAGPSAGPAAQNTSATSGASKGTGSGELAFTGAELSGWLVAALSALGLGVVLRLLGRRRRDRDVRGG
ncbi:Ig-like domain-containing protein [Curtobacterium sp. VKM Ac-1393]|uniref:Ig-like domain-containing protein n=1 Tax=Curtobacterium sp. VKM Ac-1393 TaxID=2783814 RepID=UPI00188D39E3|nr:Ig-like domain-containing protein [Curtobacterium sp. VKM Ac-1393]MBF4607658.1 hypothetical protein [Curtobacterium sp. VKM Ac-1393]